MARRCKGWRGLLLACLAAGLGWVGWVAGARAQPAGGYRVAPAMVAVDNERLVSSVRRVAITQLVVPHEQLAALPDFQKLKDAGKPSPLEGEKFTGRGGWTFSPRGLPVVWDSDDEESFMQSSRDPDPCGEQYRSGGSPLGGNSTGPRWAEWGLAKALDAYLLKVRVTILLAVSEYRLNADPACSEAEVLAAARATFADFGPALQARCNPS